MQTSTFRLFLWILALACTAFSDPAYAQCQQVCDNNDNTGLGTFTLQSLNTGTGNTAVGTAALRLDDQGSGNTACGDSALYGNTSGGNNTAAGYFALNSNKTGSFNTADGFNALLHNTSDFNTATGAGALELNTSGTYNTATGFDALNNNQAGHDNTADGMQALLRSTGSNNVGVGSNAGANLTTGNGNIIIGAGLLGDSADANVTRIGKTNQKKVFIGGIYNIAEPAASGIKPVYINSTGQLGTTPPASSARFKEVVKPMEKASEGILSLRPVTFRYKDDTERIPQFGLIAEEVAKINPDLVIRDEKGEIYTVRYDAVNAMLLNEFLKEHRKVEELNATVTQQNARSKRQDERIAQQQRQIEALTSAVQQVSDKMELQQAASHTSVAGQ